MSGKVKAAKPGGGFFAPLRMWVVLHDVLMVAVCWLGLRWLLTRHGLLPAGQGELVTLAWVVAVQALVFWAMGLYRGLWRFASLPDLFNLSMAALGGAAGIGISLFFRNHLAEVPAALLVLYPLVLVALLGGPRILYRAWKDGLNARSKDGQVRVLVLGAGAAGETFVRELRRSGEYVPVGFLDDDPRLGGTRVHGLPVLGQLQDAKKIARETASGMLLIAIPSLSTEAMQQVIALCETTGLPFRMLPRPVDLLSGRVLPGELKEVAIEDLLGREPVIPDWDAIRNWLRQRRVLVSGAGGSIGAELCRQCARHGASVMTLLEQDELSLLRIQQELQRDFPQLSLIPVLGDCGDAAVVRHALKTGGAGAVFHAAAYKQVPVLEEQPREALRNNVLATDVMAREADAAGVETFVLISTDKAVNPTTVLGASKRLAETVCRLHARQSRTHFVTVRFGNVLDSAGSVVPLFREQIRQGGPVTVTHPEVTRYFMTIPEACQLILQAVAFGEEDVIYTLDMGKPVSIRHLAEQMIFLAGKRPGEDVQIVYTGLRRGEKLHEVLFHHDEHYTTTAHRKIFRGNARALDVAAQTRHIAAIRQAVEAYDVAAMMQLLHAAVPEFSPLSHPPAERVAGMVLPARNA